MKYENFENENELSRDVELEEMNELSRRGRELEEMNELFSESESEGSDAKEEAYSDEDTTVYGIDEDGEVIIPDEDTEEILDEVGEGLLVEDEIDEMLADGVTPEEIEDLLNGA